MDPVSNSGIVTLNVGGQLFSTTISTLTSKESFFKCLVERCPADHYFIDRDPTFFRWVLNHLRGSTLVPSDHRDYAQFQFEMDFYCLTAPPFNKNTGIAYQLSVISAKMA